MKAKYFMGVYFASLTKPCFRRKGLYHHKQLVERIFCPFLWSGLLLWTDALAALSCFMVTGFLNLPTTTKILHHNDGIV